MHKRSLEKTCYVLGAGAFGVFFRWLQNQLAFDEAGLNEKSAFNVLVPAVIIAMAWMYRRFIKDFRRQRYFIDHSFTEALFNPGKVFDFVRWLCGGLMCVGAVILVMTSETDVDATLIKFLCLLAFLSGIAFPYVLGSANYDYVANEGLVRTGMLMPILLYALWLVLSYKQNSYNSVEWSYAVEMITLIAAMLAFFRIAGFAYHSVDGKKCLFAVMFGASMCIMGLADKRYLGMQIILLSSALMLADYNWILVLNMKKREPRQKEENKVDEGGFEQLN